MPKHEEHKYKPITTEEEIREKNIYPSYIDYPPLIHYMLVKNGVAEPKLRLTIPNDETDPNLYRVARDGEKATVEFPKGFGKAINKDLVAGVNYDI